MSGTKLPVDRETSGKAGLKIPHRHGSVAVSRGIRVEVQPAFLKEHSRPEGTEIARPEFVFAYRIQITNEGETRVKLLSRYWLIVDSDGERHEVAGDGVVGEQPELDPGESHEYASFCPLPTSWGTMEGHYVMRVESGPSLGELFEAKVDRFFLVAK